MFLSDLMLHFGAGPSNLYEMVFLFCGRALRHAFQIGEAADGRGGGGDAACVITATTWLARKSGHGSGSAGMREEEEEDRDKGIAKLHRTVVSPSNIATL